MLPRTFIARVLLRRCFAIGLGMPLALLGCDYAPTESAGQLAITIAADRDRLSPASPASLTVTITNRGRGSASVPDPRSLRCSPPYRVFDAADREVPIPDRVCTLQGFPPRTLRAGESLVVRDEWAGTTRGGDRTAIPVAPGSYRLRGRIVLSRHEYASPAIEVTVGNGS